MARAAPPSARSMPQVTWSPRARDATGFTELRPEPISKNPTTGGASVLWRGRACAGGGPETPAEPVRV
jgi:hypothetical protein